MVTKQPKDGHPTEGSVLQTRNLALKFCSQNEELDQNFHGWSPTISRMVTNQPKDGHPPEGSVVQTWNLALKFNSQNKSQVSTSMDGHLPSLGWSPTNPRMVTHQPKDGHPPEEGIVKF